MIIGINDSEGVAGHIDLLCPVIAEELIGLTKVKLLHARDKHLGDLLLLDSLLNGGSKLHLSLTRVRVCEVHDLVHVSSQLL